MHRRGSSSQICGSFSPAWDRLVLQLKHSARRVGRTISFRAGRAARLKTETFAHAIRRAQVHPTKYQGSSFKYAHLSVTIVILSGPRQSHQQLNIRSTLRKDPIHCAPHGGPPPCV
jgi:hypothetical protein